MSSWSEVSIHYFLYISYLVGWTEMAHKASSRLVRITLPQTTDSSAARHANNSLSGATLNNHTLLMKRRFQTKIHLISEDTELKGTNGMDNKEAYTSEIYWDVRVFQPDTHWEMRPTASTTWTHIHTWTSAIPTHTDTSNHHHHTNLKLLMTNIHFHTQMRWEDVEDWWADQIRCQEGHGHEHTPVPSVFHSHVFSSFFKLNRNVKPSNSPSCRWNLRRVNLIHITPDRDVPTMHCSTWAL